MMDWRTWAHDRLTVPGNPLLALVPSESIHASGSMVGAPKNKPFIIVRMGQITRSLPEDGYLKSMTVWVHDEPGGYKRIDEALELIRAQLEGPVAEVGAISCDWTGDSTDLADDGYGTITRNSSYTLAGVG